MNFKQGIKGFADAVMLSPELFAAAAALVGGDPRKVWIVVSACAMTFLDAGRDRDNPMQTLMMEQLQFGIAMALNEAKIDPKRFYGNLNGFIDKVRRLSETGERVTVQ